jgi:hypothetical protein
MYSYTKYKQATENEEKTKGSTSQKLTFMEPVTLQWTWHDNTAAEGSVHIH